MRIGQWSVCFVRWAIVFEKRQVPVRQFVGWDEFAAYYTAEDIKRWQDELRDHLRGM